MAFTDHPNQAQGIELLQRSLVRGRLAHGYLFSGHQLDELETLARTLAKTLNCRQPVRQNGIAIDCCDQCISCKKIEHDNHADVFWVRPESKSRQIKIGQFVRRDDSPPRVLLDFVNLKPTESEYKVAIVVAADRMNEQAANAFLKTLEEPPAKCVLILLTIEPQRLLETILSRCLRLNFGGGSPAQFARPHLPWLATFVNMAAAEQKSLIGRYRLLDLLLGRLTEVKEEIVKNLTARSPLERHPDADQNLRDRWEDELAAAIEAEYRRQRGDVLGVVQWWLRDVWLQTLAVAPPTQLAPEQTLLAFPDIPGAAAVARRISVAEATTNLDIIEHLQGWLGTNVQEALTLEVSLLKLRL